ncbi:MAG: cupin domain-containing protein [Candidatus Binatia bacterium]
MKVLKIRDLLKELEEISEEICYKSCVEGKGFSTGVISFQPIRRVDPKQITHRDKDVVCHVLKGRGRLRIAGRRFILQPGTFCHIPRGTSHDFTAGRSGELVLLYSLITTG